MIRDRRIVVLGVGNRLLCDDAAGPLVIERLGADAATAADDRLVLCDGGTVGLALLPCVEETDALIAVDSASFGAAPGTVRVFEGADMDAVMGGRHRSAHEVALADVMAAAALRGRLPQRRALVAVQPQCTRLGLEPSAAVQAALPDMCRAVHGLVQRWCP